jgi:hypothetical protein
MTATPQIRYDSTYAPLEPPQWRWFWAWAGVGLLVPMTLLGAFTIGLYMVPLAVIGTLLLVRRPAARRGFVGLVAGFGAPFLVVALLNRDGPGTICTSTATSQSCLQEWSPWPWVAVGLLFLAAGVWLFSRQRSGRG